MIDKKHAVFVVVDVQGKLAQMMFRKDILFHNLKLLIQGMRLLEVPIILMEQTPDKIGATVPEIIDLLPGVEPIKKKTFSCAGNSEFNSRLEELAPTDVILAGIETHVCVYQTAVDLLSKGLQVHVVTDAVSSRLEANKQTGLNRMVAEGGHATSTEMLLFELQRRAGGNVFRELIKLVR
jgi:nicotinamidase-related amidase